MAATIRAITGTLDLVYSPDDAAWYFQEYLGNSNTRQSVCYETEQIAMEARRSGLVVWHE